MSLIILGIMVLCGASAQAIGVTAIALGILQLLLMFITKIIQNQNSYEKTPPTPSPHLQQPLSRKHLA